LTVVTIVALRRERASGSFRSSKACSTDAVKVGAVGVILAGSSRGKSLRQFALSGDSVVDAGIVVEER